MLGGTSICLCAQRLAKVTSKHITQLCFVNNEDLIIFQNTLDAEKFAVEKIIKWPLYNGGVLYGITRMPAVLRCGSLPLTAVVGSSVSPLHKVITMILCIWHRTCFVSVCHRAWKRPRKGHSCALPSLSFPIVDKWLIQIAAFFPFLMNMFQGSFGQNQQNFSMALGP